MRSTKSIYFVCVEVERPNHMNEIMYIDATKNIQKEVEKQFGKRAKWTTLNNSI